MKLVVVVLAAGKSRRFGSRDKLRVAVAGRPLAAHIVRTLAGLPRHRAVVVLRDPRLGGLFSGFQRVRVAPGVTAQGVSLAAGLRAARRIGASHALLVLADMPCVTRSDLRHISTGALGHPVMAQGPKSAMPPALIPRACFARLMAGRADAGAGQVLRGRPDLILRALPPSHLIDIDRPRDLKRVQSQGDCSRSSGIFR